MMHLPITGIVSQLSKIWSYTTLAVAESSGDSWNDGDIIRITNPSPDVDFRYWVALDTAGHSGLVHRFPHGGSNEYRPNLYTAVSGDPDVWSDWNTIVTPFNTQDAGLNGSRFIASTTGEKTWGYRPGFNLPADAVHTFSICNDSYFDAPAAGGYVRLTAKCYDGVTINAVTINQDKAFAGSSNLYLFDADGVLESIGVAGSANANFYIYVMGSAYAIWRDDVLVKSGVPAATGGLATWAFFVGEGFGNAATISASSFLFGNLR